MTSTFKLPQQTDPPLSPRQTLPTMYDLPSEYPEEPGLSDEFHIWQPQILLLTFKPSQWNPHRVFSATDMNIYYDVSHPLWHKRPDWFGVVGVPRLYEEQEMRLSYVCWQEEAHPFIVVELLSPSTEDEDLGHTTREPGEPATKWEVYEQILRIPYYFIFSRYTNKLQAFHLVGGHYEPAVLTDGRLAIPELGLSLGLWEGVYQGLNRLWLRWRTLEGELILLPQEEASLAQQQVAATQLQINTVQQEMVTMQQQIVTMQQQMATVQQQMATVQQQTNAAENRANLAEQRAQKLATKLQELGINPRDLL